MKKTYEKPVLVRRQRLSSVTAGPGPSTVIIAPVD
ncbi:putative RiPP precursor [Mesorhizobium sp. CU2]|nr:MULTISPECIES: putative RiPP precursor [unclassified Mesorhizobium]TPN74532.1 putative RiPP precursor [Mesorhizobium sp. CU3]TPO06715.1 putative RiPP precursor [Mesorhizobium sp. CU2]